MKDKQYIDIICKDFCKYYKGNKENLRCRGYDFLVQNLTLSELRLLVDSLNLDTKDKNNIPDFDFEIDSLICKNCEFYVDDCDYSNNLSGPPCGGYNIIRNIL